jgi:transposase
LSQRGSLMTIVTDSSAPLPDDIAALQALVRAQAMLLDSRVQEIEHLKALIAKLRRMQFGARSERLESEIEQLELKLEEIEVEAPTDEEIAALKAVASPANEASGAVDASGATRTPRRARLWPDHLPRETVLYTPACECPDCGAGMAQIGEDVAEQLDYVPASIRVIRHVRPKLACTRCDRIVQAPAPSRPIDRGLPGPGLLAHVLVAKYVDHLPLYRQSQMFARGGLDLERSTLAQWVGLSLRNLRPLVDSLYGYVFAGPKLHADDTPVPVLEPGRGKTKTGRLWTYVRDDRAAKSPDPPAVAFRYSPNRRGEHPREHLKTFRGTLQADAYAGFAELYKHSRIREAACWAHARRGFFDIHAASSAQGGAGSPIAREALERIGRLYDIERSIRGQSASERQAARAQRAAPELESLHAWLRDTLGRVSKKSEIAQAIGYVLTRWRALTRYLEDGLIEIDNNAAERALRAVAIGRKNYLFCGADSGGERAAAIYSLVGTAKLNGIDPEAYLRYVFERIADHPIKRVAELLPWAVAGKITPHQPIEQPLAA